MPEINGVKSEANNQHNFSSLGESNIEVEKGAPIERASSYGHNDVSDKVRILLKILNDSLKANPKAKTIIFVKDRSVACYLKKILVGSTEKVNKDMA